MKFINMDVVKFPRSNNDNKSNDNRSNNIKKNCAKMMQLKQKFEILKNIKFYDINTDLERLGF